MTVETQHPEYSARVGDWAKCRATVEGQKAVHAGGEDYLPRLDKQTNAQYQAYRDRALFLGATGRTVDNLTGLIFRKKPVFDLPQAMEVWTEDITASGISLEGLARTMTVELLSVGRLGLLVDYPPRPQSRVTVAKAEMSGIRPRMRVYLAENIINWRTDTVNNKTMLTMVVLTEDVPAPEDEFDTTTAKARYRVLDLNEGVYRQRVYEDFDGASEPTLIEEITPTSGGKTLDFIPFLILGPNGIKPETECPPLNDLVDINLSHYKVYADYRHGMHYTALPTPVVTGHTLEKGETLTIGAQEAWVFSNEAAKAFYLEFAGQGLAPNKDELERLEMQMANFGARLLREVKRAAEAAETASINRAGESSILASWASVVAEALRRGLEIMRDWSGTSGEISVELNTDYLPAEMDSQKLTALLSAVSSGQMSFDTFWYNLVRGELAPEDRTAEEERDLIDMDGPGLLAVAPSVQGGDDAV